MPIATGRKAIVRRPRIQAASEIGPVTRTIDKPRNVAATEATKRNHFICWRSIPRERRNRRSRLLIATRNATTATPLLIPFRVCTQSPTGAGRTTGLTSPSMLSSGSVDVAAATTPIVIATMTPTTKMRQRGPGRWPEGKTIGRKTTRMPIVGGTVQAPSQAAGTTSGSPPP